MLGCSRSHVELTLQGHIGNDSWLNVSRRLILLTTVDDLSLGSF